MGIGVGLAAVALLLTLFLITARSGEMSAPSAWDVSSDIRALIGQLADQLSLSRSGAPMSMQAHALGIDLPRGADVQDLPTGLTDYLRVKPTPVASMRSFPLGIDLPKGADGPSLPHGLTDYLRPRSDAVANQAQPVYLGITLPAGAKRSDLPAGLTDYLRPGQ
jgi:hypothetical protein